MFNFGQGIEMETALMTTKLGNQIIEERTVNAPLFMLGAHFKSTCTQVANSNQPLCVALSLQGTNEYIKFANKYYLDGNKEEFE